jgi:hypothetical protein
MSDSFTLKNAWLGYDLPYDIIEQQPSVQGLRKAGIQKRIKLPEFHVTVCFFPELDKNRLEEELRQASKEISDPLEQTAFFFNAYGIIEQNEGAYVYFNPDEKSGKEASVLQAWMKEHSSIKTLQAPDLHLSIGGPDPFGTRKLPQKELGEPFQVEGKLMLVGNDGKRSCKFFWNQREGCFIDPNTSPAEPSRSEIPATSSPTHPIHTIAIFPKIQADTATAVFLLKNFGEKKFPGISKARVVFWTTPPSQKTPETWEEEGYLLVDLGGRFDHHITNRRQGNRTECVSTLIAKFLEMDKNPALQKILTWARRDDLEGKGTVSNDPIDRAFGLSGIIMNLNREFHDQPQKALDFVLSILHVHISEELRRHVELPELWTKLLSSGKGGLFNVKQSEKELKGAYAETDNIALAGFLRAAKKIDLVVQRASDGHTNIITHQQQNIDLRPLIAALRLAESEKNGGAITSNHANLFAPGKLHEVQEWYYDDAANSLQNGGINPQGVPSTKLSLTEILQAIQTSIPQGKMNFERKTGAVNE